MYLLQKAELMYEFVRRLSTVVPGHHFGGNKSTVSFMKKYVNKREAIRSVIND
jgi:hypothetical protein